MRTRKLPEGSPKNPGDYYVFMIIPLLYFFVSRMHSSCVLEAPGWVFDPCLNAEVTQTIRRSRCAEPEIRQVFAFTSSILEVVINVSKTWSEAIPTSSKILRAHGKCLNIPDVESCYNIFTGVFSNVKCCEKRQKMFTSFY